MKNRKRKTLIIIGAALFLLSASAFQGRRLMTMRERGERVELQNAPPAVVFTSIVLGGFKGILADVLWLRASLLQDEGRYLELVQLADWITKLEPGISEVWSFHAWNMAYNVSVMMPKPEDRWRWVFNGMSLLRDEGILYNSNDPNLYFELGWLFQNKMGESIDVMHLYYKKEWAKLMSAFTRADGSVDYSRLTKDQRQRLEDEFRLDVDVMRRIDELYGPFDWRLPEANAVYWGFEGIKVAGDNGHVACDRVVYQSIMQMFRRGRLDFDADSGKYNVSFNPQLLTGAMKAFEDAVSRNPGNRSVSSSYSNFLREAVRRLHDAGLTERSKELFVKLSREYGDSDTEKGYDAFLESDPEYPPIR